MTEAEKRAKKKYKEKVKRYEINCFPTEPELIAKLEAEKQNKQSGGYAAYIKRLIKADIEKSK